VCGHALAFRSSARFRSSAVRRREEHVSRDRRVSAYSTIVPRDAEPACDVTCNVTRDVRRALRKNVTRRNDARQSTIDDRQGIG